MGAAAYGYISHGQLTLIFKYKSTIKSCYKILNFNFNYNYICLLIYFDIFSGVPEGTNVGTDPEVAGTTDAEVSGVTVEAETAGAPASWVGVEVVQATKTAAIALTKINVLMIFFSIKYIQLNNSESIE